jgi:photosystem II stability/assembly factor-like uncharacterized protein
MPVSVVRPRGWYVPLGPPPPAEPSPDWSVAPLGAGGWITGLDVHSDGTLVARPDTYGCYKFDRETETWTQMVSADSMPVDYHLPYSIFGGHEICIAPSDSDVMYLSWGSSGFPTAAVFKSVDGGVTWTETALNGITLDSNTDQRHYSPKMAVDPANPDVVWFGEPGGGVYYTDDGGDTWTQQTQIAESDHEYGFVFDAESTVTGGKTTKIYIASHGTGVYRSTDAGANFTLTTGTPTTFIGMTCSNNGSTSVDSSVLLVNGTHNLYRWAGGAWTALACSNSGASFWDVAVNPLDTDQVLVVQDSGRFSQSADNGVTFIDQGGGNEILYLNNIISGDTIPWHEMSNEESYMSHGGIRFDPLESHGPGTVFIGSGIGVFWTNFLTTDPLYKTVQWTSMSVGIEQLVMQELVKVPSGGLLTVQLDRGTLYLEPALDTYSAYTAPSMSIGTVNGYGAAVADDGKMWIIYDEGIYYTDDHLPGNVIESEAATFAGLYGCIAVDPTDSDNVVAQVASGAPYYTTDGGATWTAGTGAPTGLPVPSFAKTHWLRAAGLTPGTFYIYGIASGIYKSTDGGATWALSYARDADEGDGFPLYNAFNNLYNVELASPRGSDDLWLSTGHAGSFPDSLTPETTDSSLIRFTGAGTVATRITNAAEPYRIGFGVAGPGKTYGTLFMVGWVDRGDGWEFGTWRCDDPDAGAVLDWVDIDQWPNGSFDQVTTIAGDPEVYGRVYIGFNGSSVVWRDTDHITA